MIRNFICLAIMLFFLITGVQSYTQTNALIADYNQSPGCTAHAPASGALTPCVQGMARVIDKTMYRDGVRHGRTHYSLNLQDDTGQRQPVEVLDSRVYYAVAVGEDVRVQIWRGKVCLVSTGAKTAQTPDNPEAQHQSARYRIAAGLLFGFFLLVSVLRGQNSQDGS